MLRVRPIAAAIPYVSAARRLQGVDYMHLGMDEGGTIIEYDKEIRRRYEEALRLEGELKFCRSCLDGEISSIVASCLVSCHHLSARSAPWYMNAPASTP